MSLAGRCQVSCILLPMMVPVKFMTDGCANETRCPHPAGGLQALGYRVNCCGEATVPAFTSACLQQVRAHMTRQQIHQTSAVRRKAVFKVVQGSSASKPIFRWPGVQGPASIALRLLRSMSILCKQNRQHLSFSVRAACMARKDLQGPSNPSPSAGC